MGHGVSAFKRGSFSLWNALRCNKDINTPSELRRGLYYPNSRLCFGVFVARLLMFMGAAVPLAALPVMESERAGITATGAGGDLHQTCRLN